MRRRWAAAIVAAVGTTALAVPATAAAHGLVGRADLPIPAWLFGWAAAVVLIVSFAALATLWQTPKLEGDEGFRPLPDAVSFTLVNPATEVFAGLVGVFLLGVTIWSGLAGVQSPQANFAPTFVYVIFWVGLVLLSILFGDVFRAFNPWRAIARFAGAVATRVSGPMPAPFRYPDRLGRWPATVGLLGFAWMELAYRNGDDPSTLAIAALVYSAVTLLAIACFGTETWMSRGEAFSVYFNLFSRMSPLTVRDGRLGLRRPLSGVARMTALPGTVALLFVMIGTVMFDGASEGSPWVDIAPDIQDFFIDLGLGPASSLEATFTIGMLLALGLVALIYAAGVYGVRTIDRRPAVDIARSFIHTLVPIAAVYVLAHYFSLLAYNGQAMAYLASDPLGKGWDLFGMADKAIDYSVIGATAIWYVQVGVLVSGHVCGLVLAHDRALALYGKARTATTSQYWMLAVMVAFTTFGLFLLSQANQ
ncbi:MAG TPA: fenitrothion hydrolase [Solirubrobacterales bacterium]|nr:fenitrothion hydrolase [Solirubrobacterales bacterium]